MARNKRSSRAARSRKKLSRKQSRVNHSRGSSAGLSARALQIEQLEDRRMLAVFFVNTSQDLLLDLSGPAPGSLRQAIISANASPDADTILFADNITNIFLQDNPAGDFGDLAITEPVSILGPGPRKLTISGAPGSRIFTVSDDTEDTFINVSISGVTIYGGSANGGDDEDDSFGGAILNYETLNIIESEISGSTAVKGGGIFTDLGYLNLERSLVRNNSSLEHGGGIYNGLPMKGTLSRTLIRNSTISGNTAGAATGYGGGVFNRYGYVTIRQSTISGNEAYLGGGVASHYYENPMGPPVETIKTYIGSSIVFGNTTTAPGGGDIDDPGAMPADPEGTPPIPFPLIAGYFTENWNIIGTGTVFDSAFRGLFDRTDVERNPLIDPLLGPLADFGGALDVYLPGEGSIAIDPNFIPSNFTIDSDDVDFNSDGDIGGMDFLAWQRGFGLPVPVTPPDIVVNPKKSDGDSDRNFKVDAADLKEWTMFFGDTREPHVPPGTIVILPIPSMPQFVDYIDPGTIEQRGRNFARVFGGIVDIGATEVQQATFEVSEIDDFRDNQFSGVNFGNTAPGNLSLREALDFSEKNPGLDTITFSSVLASQTDPTPFTPAPTILLDPFLGSLNATQSVNFIGPSGFQLEIDANDSFRVFNFDDGENGVAQDISVSNLTLINGNAIGSGGAIFSRENLTVTNSTFEGNAASLNGAAIFTQFGDLKVDSSTLSGNAAASNGGAVYIDGVKSTYSNGTPDPNGIISNVTIINSTISGNSAGNRGAGIFNSGPDTEISYSTITLNNSSSTRGSGIWNFPTADAKSNATGASTLEVTSSIVSGNLNSDIEESFLTPGYISSGGFNLIGIGNADSVFIADGTSQTGVLDPELAPLDFGGGITKVHALLGNTGPAYNAGNPSPLNAPEFDQRNFPFVRVTDGQIDIGAYELQAVPHLVSSAGDGSDGDFSFGNFTLREAVELSNLSSTDDFIEFSSILFGATITVNSPITITDELTITGLGSTLLSIAGTASTPFIIDDGDAGNDIVAQITGIAFVGGSAGFISNKENLTLGRINGAGFPVDGVTFTGNTGGVLQQQGGSLAVIASTITGNSKAGLGGAFNVQDATFDITYSVISGNSTTISEANGGGIYLKNSALVGDRAYITSNITPSGDSDGAGIFAIDSTIDLTNSIISGNVTTGSNSEGAGIAALDTAAGLDAAITLTDSTVALNRTTGTQSQGGGIYLYGGSLTLNNTLISQNTTAGLFAYGGGIANNGGTITINQSTVVQNSTAGDSAYGGGIYSHDGTVTIFESTVGSNSTAGIAAHGGGIYSVGGDLTVRDSTIEGNSVTGTNAEGGGVYSDGESLSITTLILNSTISGNSTLSKGGGLFNAGGTTSILHSTITLNTATFIGSAGGVGSFGDSSTTLTEVGSSIISGNFASSAGPAVASDVDRVGGVFDETFVSLGYNLIGDGLSIGAFNATGDQTGVDSMLLALANNGGPTRTHAFLAGSPAINAGDPAFDATNFDPDLDFDQTGVDRVQNGQIDIGSFESNLAPPAPLAAASTSSSEESPLAATASSAQFTITGSQAETPLRATSAETNGEEFEGLTTWLSRWKSRVAATLQTAAQRFNPDALAVSFDKFEVAARDASLAKFAHISDEVSQLTDDLGSLVESLQPGTSGDEPVAEDMVFELLGEGLL